MKDPGTLYSLRLELEAINRSRLTIHSLSVGSVADVEYHGRYQKLSAWAKDIAVSPSVRPVGMADFLDLLDDTDTSSQDSQPPVLSNAKTSVGF